MKTELSQYVKTSSFRPQSTESKLYLLFISAQSRTYTHMTSELGLFTSEESSNQAHKVTRSLYPQGRVETLILVTMVELFWSSALCNQYFLRCTGICCFCGYKCRRQLLISWQNVSHVLYYLHPEQKRKHQKHCKIMAFIFHLWFALNLLVLFRQSISPKSYFSRESTFELLQSLMFLSRQKASHVFM